MFSENFKELSIQPLMELAANATDADVSRVLSGGAKHLEDFAVLLSDVASGRLEELCARSQELTLQRFGKTIRFFAPLYLSNECVNNCSYCGFSRDNPINRVTLTVDEVVKEAENLREQGFRNVLLVAGEHPKFVSNGYMEECISALHERIPSLSLEVGPMEMEEYVPMVKAGAEGLVVYQETYAREPYAEVHTAGPKKHFDWRLDTAERAYEAGFRRLGIGALFGLSDWRYESFAVAAHTLHLLKYCWKAQLTVSFPRLRPCAGAFQPKTSFGDRDLVQLMAAIRILCPDVGLILSTREPENLRNGLIPIGVTHMSAGSHTEPGGYTGAGKNKIHKTERGKIVELAGDSSEWAPVEGRETNATGQFEIADERSPSEVANVVRSLGYEPVWKDFDAALTR
ncbi:2-iminoacetate synthase ThiH [Verrucomicrobia bacterium]|nr:2-iminoacetate synthase ThiH [Verrucomicrobiota bacterium]